LGNHATYKLRYSNEFNFFNKVPSTNHKVNLLREYDNAVKYNDYILFNVLSMLKKQKGEKSFIMFSDHGESLFDKQDQCYHGSAFPAKSEVEIPLVLWFSDSFKNHHPDIIKQVVANKNLPVLSSDFFHAFPPLFGIYFNKLKPQNNFFSSSYVPKKHRKIVNVNMELKEYDKLSNQKNTLKY
jgi:heptose-I-phosphate ethanolaminephosphotransferase